jgi:hypothetical protein
VNQPIDTGNTGEVVVSVVPNTLAIYRNLRIGLGVTAVLLLASILIQSTYVRRPIDKHCWQGALSEYFYTSAHSIFIASLLGLATLFFVYRGSSDTESALLTLAGVAALTAALVPQGKDDIVHCTPLFIPDELKVADVIRPNLVAIVAALGLAWGITLFQRHFDRKNQNGITIRQKKSAGGIAARCILWLGWFSSACRRLTHETMRTAQPGFCCCHLLSLPCSLPHTSPIERKCRRARTDISGSTGASTGGGAG